MQEKEKEINKMAKILCAFSGLLLEVSHFPIHLSERECSHPIFCIPQKKLLSYARKWSAQELTTTDSYLLFLALLKSTDHIVFRSAVTITPETDALVAQNMHSLIGIIGKMNTIVHPGFSLPKFVVSTDTTTLENVGNWLKAWRGCLEDFASGFREYNASRALLNREAALERLIKNPTKSTESYSKTLATWAAIAGSFPTYVITTETGSHVPMSEYWIDIIQRCCKNVTLANVPSVDLNDLIEHCEEHIPHGSIYAAKLMQVLRNAVEVQKNFLGTGAFSFSILQGGDSKKEVMGGDSKGVGSIENVEYTNVLNLISTAPETCPTPGDFKSKFEYLKAVTRYEMAERYKKEEKNGKEQIL